MTSASFPRLSLLLCLALVQQMVPAEHPAAIPATGFAFERAFNPHWFPDDARQWSAYDQSVLITDFSRAEPVSALTTGKRQKGKWKVVPFETAGFAGNALSIYQHTRPVPVIIKLGRTGWHAVYVGLSTVSGGINLAQPSGVRCKLGSSGVYRRIANNLKLLEPRRDVIQEQFLTVANLGSDETAEFAQLSSLPATVAYLRLVPLGESERLAWERDSLGTDRRTSAATFDGHSWIWPHEPRRAEDLEENFEGFQQSDFGQWWFGILGADLVCYPTDVGTIAGIGTEDFPTEHHGSHAKSVLALIANDVNPLKVASATARSQGREFHVFVRPQAWGASIPFEETFNSRFFLDHPEWRCVDREGRKTLFMSYAVPEVRRQIVDVLREAVEMAGADGVGFFFNRGMPLMLWESPFADRFLATYGVDIMSVGEEDFRIHELRATIMTELLREVRDMLDEVGRNGGRRLTITAATLTQQRFNERFGLDVDTWVAEGLVDQLAPIVAYHTSDGVNKYGPPDLDYYRRVVRGSEVKVYPVVVAWSTQLWNNGKLEDFCRLLTRWYGEGADGIAVWDPEVERGFKNDMHEGTALGLLGNLGHRELIAYWAAHGVPLPNSFPLTKLGENEYSPLFPNTGY